MHGTVSGFDPTTGALTYTSDPEYSGPDLIRFTACDRFGACATGVIQLTVVAIGGGGAVGDLCPRVVISEVNWGGTDAGEGEEWIELRNLEDRPVDLTGWTLRWRSLDADTPEASAWRTLSLNGELRPALEDSGLRFTPETGTSAIWRVTWSDVTRPDHYLMERGSDDVVLHFDADLVYPAEDEFGLSTELSDEGALVELHAPSGCLTDTANLFVLPGMTWPAGSSVPPASMERSDPTAIDAPNNWHTNLGLVRQGFDAFGDLISGTPKGVNSPILELLVRELEGEAASFPAGVSVVLTVGIDAVTPIDDALWYLVVTSSDGTVQPAMWTVGGTPGEEASITIYSTLLPRDETLHVWMRTPRGHLFFAPIVILP